MTMPASSVLPDPSGYASSFGEWDRARSDPVWLRKSRAAAIEEFARLGFPTTRQEDWKYTDVSPIRQAAFAPHAPRGPEHADVEAHRLPDLGAHEVVLVNGRLVPSLARGPALPHGLRVQPILETVARGGPDAVLGTIAKHEGRPFTALNAAYFADGVFIDVPRGLVLENPIHVLHVTTAAAEKRLVAPRVLLQTGEASQVQVIESFVGSEKGAYFTNAVTEILAGPSSIVDHLKLQSESSEAFHVARTAIKQERGSVVRSHLLTTGGRLVRQDIDVLFAGEGAEADLDGLYLLGDSQHTDLHTTIDHVPPHCTSREFYKGILDGRARGVFYGKVLVRKGAQKTDAMQTNKNLLLSDGALVDSTPALEINADDVKCGHGSTIGQLDKNQLFYLRSRGLPEATARGILIHAFARDVLTRFRPERIRALLAERLLRRFPHGENIQEALREIE